VEERAGSYPAGRRVTSGVRALLSFLALALAALPAAAQPTEVLSDSASASLLTMLPGEEVYSLFGHTALRLRDPATGLDRTYNYGTFDFNQPYFVLRFTRGQLDYMLDTAPFEREVEKYQSLGRPMIEQRLALPPATVRALYDILETNALPEHREYRYDFFFDNCSTRPLDRLDDALAASGLPRVTLPDAPEDSFRDLLRPYYAPAPALRFGSFLGLGLPADRLASPRERTFLPLELMRLLDGATVGERPLVAARDTVFWVPGYRLAPRAFDAPLWLGWGLLALGIGVTALGLVRGRAGAKAGRLGDAFLFGGAGLAGLVLLLLWVATEHRVTGPNLNLLWAWLSHLAAAIALVRGTLTRGWRVYLGLAGGAALIVAAGWFLWPQDLPAPALPLVLLLAVRALARARSALRPT